MKKDLDLRKKYVFDEQDFEVSYFFNCPHSFSTSLRPPLRMSSPNLPPHLLQVASLRPRLLQPALRSRQATNKQRRREMHLRPTAPTRIAKRRSLKRLPLRKKG